MESYADNRYRAAQNNKVTYMRILLVDDQSKILSALRLLLEQEGMMVIGEVAKAEDLLVHVEVTRPDVALLDWELPGLQTADPSTGSAPRLLSKLRAHYPQLRVIALSGRPEARQTALAAGVDAFVSKGDPAESLLKTLRTITAGTKGGSHA
jgi:two-component system response regulator DesR